MNVTCRLIGPELRSEGEWKTDCFHLRVWLSPCSLRGSSLLFTLFSCDDNRKKIIQSLNMSVYVSSRFERASSGQVGKDLILKPSNVQMPAEMSASVPFCFCLLRIHFCSAFIFALKAAAAVKWREKVARRGSTWHYKRWTERTPVWIVASVLNVAAEDRKKHTVAATERKNNIWSDRRCKRKKRRI